MKNKYKIFGILLLAAFSFFYTDKVSYIIKQNDPIMKKIKSVKEDMVVNKTDPVIINDEYLTGINGCVVDEEESYNNMKNTGSFDEDLIVMKEDKVNTPDNSYIKGGNKKNRNISIILLNTNTNLNKYLKKNNIKINYFLDGNYIISNIDKIIKLSKYSKIYSYGRDNIYDDKYISYDNSIIKNNLNNNSDYCLVSKKDDKTKDLCLSHNMKIIKEEIIKEDILLYTKENISNGKIFVFDNYDYKNMELVIKYIMSKGYNIVYLDTLLNENSICN